MSATVAPALYNRVQNRTFRDAYKKKFGEEPEEFAVMGCDAVRFIIEAVEGAAAIPSH